MQDTKKHVDINRNQADLNKILDQALEQRKKCWEEHDSGKIELSDSLVAYDVWYWEYNFKAGKWLFKGMYRNGFFSLLNSQGYAKRYSSDGQYVFFVQDVAGIIEEVIIARLVDIATAYVEDQQDIELKHERESLKVSAQLCQEKFRAQSHLLFNQNALLHLTTHTKSFLKDTPTAAYFPFKNGVVEVTAEQVTLHPYGFLGDKCVWRKEVVNRNFDLDANYENSHMALFMYNVCAGDAARIMATRTASGSLLHKYTYQSRSQVICVYDEVITSSKQAMGRTGKGLFYNAHKQIRPGAHLDGKKFDETDRFCFQQVEMYHAFVCLDDPKPKLDFKRFFSVTTEGWIIEKKNKPTLHIAPEDSPKLLILSNTVLDNEGTSNKARQFIIEFSDHYSKQIKIGTEEPIVEEHGGMFFTDDWPEDEWARFDRYMISNVQLYLKYGLVPYQSQNVANNRLRQIAGDDFVEFVTQYGGQGLQTDVYYDCAQLYQEFKTAFQLDEKDMRQRGFTDRLKKFAASKGWEFQRRVGGSNAGFWFVSKDGL